MIAVTESMTADLARQVTTLAFCWQIIRLDSVALGFTSHDCDLTIDGLRYRAAPGIAPSAIEWSGGIDTDTMDISGALSSDALTETDLMAGRYDGARVVVFLVNWSAPDHGPVFLTSGQLGRIGHDGTGFTAELKSPASKLARPAVELLSPECRASFGDNRCGINLARHTMMQTIQAVPAADRIIVDEAFLAGRQLAYGRLRFLSGANSGCEVEIAAVEPGGVLLLIEPPAFLCATGDRIEWTAGCDKRFSTCCNHYNNGANFQGEPHVPGNDLLMRYPGL